MTIPTDAPHMEANLADLARAGGMPIEDFLASMDKLEAHGWILRVPTDTPGIVRTYLTYPAGHRG